MSLFLYGFRKHMQLAPRTSFVDGTYIVECCPPNIRRSRHLPYHNIACCRTPRTCTVAQELTKTFSHIEPLIAPITMVKIHIVYYSTYAPSSIDDMLHSALEFLRFLTFCVSFGHVTKMAEEMASAITVRLTPISFRILNFPLTCIAQASGNEVAIFQVLIHTSHSYASTVPLIPDSRVLRFRRPCMHLFSRRCTLLLRFACIHHAASLCDYRCNIKLNSRNHNHVS